MEMEQGPIKDKRKYKKRIGNGRINKSIDPELQWVEKKFPQCEAWRTMALRWLASLPRIGSIQLKAISAFIEDYVVAYELPLDIDTFLSNTHDYPDFFETRCSKTPAGAQLNNTVFRFIEFVIRSAKKPSWQIEKLSENENHYHNPIVWKNLQSLHSITKTPPRNSDLTLTWVKIKYPQLEMWRTVATEWLQSRRRNLTSSLHALSVFFEHYLIKHSLPVDPKEFLSVKNEYPQFDGVINNPTSDSPRATNLIREFINFVLKTRFSMADDEGNVIVVPGFHNPVGQYSGPLDVRRDESAFSPLPYGYIDRLRQVLVGGRNFSEWTWAQNALGVGADKYGAPGPDWFPVTEAEVDRSDPDCVLRVRERSNAVGGPILEMWSPIRWVALLVKLLLPLRTFQVRMLDSGEADTWRYEAGCWALNEGRLARGTTKKVWRQGVFRKLSVRDSTLNVELYINTNKTADIGKAALDKGFTVPWPVKHDDYWGDVHYWLEKLRNWQEKYNPIKRMARWSEIDPKQVYCKSEIELASFPDACFLFRLREAAPASRHLPLLDSQFDRPWFQLLKELQGRLAENGEANADGSPIEFVRPSEKYENTRTTYFPLHSLRVSMVSGLALEGQVPYKVLMRAVGHSRLLMTLYYTKPGIAYINQALADGAAKLAENKEKNITEFLHGMDHKRLIEGLVCNSKTAIAALIPVDTKDRNPAGWLDMGHGVCLVGGNVSDSEGLRKTKLGGCFNGGPQIGFEGRGQFAPVPGGPRNCVRCRWFVTMPWYLPALKARFNNLCYHVDEAFAEEGRAESAYQKILNEQYDAGVKGIPFTGRNRLLQAERVRESAMARWNELEESRAACWILISRCLERLKNSASEAGQSLISAGSAMDVQARFEETDSELLQLSGVCEDLELYPDLEPGKAIVRRSQLLDSAFAREGRPPMFLRFSEQEQLLIGNEWMRCAARMMNPNELEIGKREVVSLIEAGERLGERIGVDLERLLVGMPGPVKVNALSTNGSRNVLHDRSSS